MSEYNRKQYEGIQSVLHYLQFASQDRQMTRLPHRGIERLPLHCRMILYCQLYYWKVTKLILSLGKQQIGWRGLLFIRKACLRPRLKLLMWLPILEELMVSRKIWAFMRLFLLVNQTMMNSCCWILALMPDPSFSSAATLLETKEAMQLSRKLQRSQKDM